VTATTSVKLIHMSTFSTVLVCLDIMSAPGEVVASVSQSASCSIVYTINIAHHVSFTLSQHRATNLALFMSPASCVMYPAVYTYTVHCRYTDCNLLRHKSSTLALVPPNLQRL